MSQSWVSRNLRLGGGRPHKNTALAWHRAVYGNLRRLFQEHFLVKPRTPPVAALDRMQSVGQKSQSQGSPNHINWSGVGGNEHGNLMSSLGTTDCRIQYYSKMGLP